MEYSNLKSLDSCRSCTFAGRRRTWQFAIPFTPPAGNFIPHKCWDVLIKTRSMLFSFVEDVETWKNLAFPLFGQWIWLLTTWLIKIMNSLSFWEVGKNSKYIHTIYTVFGQSRTRWRIALPQVGGPNPSPSAQCSLTKQVIISSRNLRNLAQALLYERRCWKCTP